MILTDRNPIDIFTTLRVPFAPSIRLKEETRAADDPHAGSAEVRQVQRGGDACADQSLDVGNDASASSDSPSFLEKVNECERLLDAVWPRSVALVHEIPRQFGRFTIVRELGRGGFGIVFLAEDSRLRRHVALKVPRPEVMVTAEFRRRFLREAEAASRLAHPHIVPVYEVGEEGPFCFIVSAYCEGPTLAEWLRGKRRPFRSAWRLAWSRSLRPRWPTPTIGRSSTAILNRVISCSSDGTRRYPRSSANESLGFVPRICDFGLAKLLDQSSQETCSGVPIGSASYMRLNRLPAASSTGQRLMFTRWE